MRSNKKLLAMVLIVLPLALLFLGGATNYENQGWDLVDSGKHCDWTGTTTFSANWNYGVNQWNSRHAVIRQDTWRTVLDLTISDINVSGVTYAGLTYSSGKIEFNRYYMDNYTIDQIRNVVIHELGHALGIGHADSSTSVIWPYVTSITSPSADDYSQFTYLYNNVY